MSKRKWKLSNAAQFISLIAVVTALVVVATPFAASQIPPLQHSFQGLQYRITKVAPPQYISDMFDDYAAIFEHHLINKLDYNTHVDLAEFIRIHSTLPQDLPKVLDLGCGTGLLAEQLQQQYNVSEFIGVDLSNHMLKISKQKQIYSKLYSEELLAFLKHNSDLYDLIAATDVFVYIGDLRAVMHQVNRSLKPSGYFAFSVESMPQGTFKLMPTGRFQHSLDYLTTTLSQQGFNVIASKSVTLRSERKIPVSGYLVLAQVPAATASNQ